MKRALIISALIILIFHNSYGYYPKSRYFPHKTSHLKLKVWYKRDITYLDQRELVLEILKKLRSYIARAENLGLSEIEKSSLESLVKSLEKQMLKTQKELKILQQKWKIEINKQNPSEENLKEIISKTNFVWENLLKFALQIYLKAQEIIK